MSYVGPAPENTCPPGTGSTFTEELGRHCVDLFIQAPQHLAGTGGERSVLWALIGGVFAALGMLLFSRRDPK